MGDELIMALITKYSVPTSRPVKIGQIELGATNPVIVQSMTNTNPLDIPASLAQFKKMVEAGAQIVRYTTPGLKDLKSLASIIQLLKENYSHIPIVADVHFNAKVAFEAARFCHKVRINPGNFSEKRKLKAAFTENEFNEALKEKEEKLKSLIDICKSNNTALRIGVNHGSLSERIMSRYGDTPEGMVESALEFLSICRGENFDNVVVSLKSSNTILMVQSVRLLAKRMLEEDLYYPLHLGVTESGDGIEGRIRSVVGIAPLLMEGFGDTIRISLTEPPENEIPVAILINRYFPKPQQLPYNPLENLPWNPCSFNKFYRKEVLGIIGSDYPPVVISSPESGTDPSPDILAKKMNGNWIFTINDPGEKLEILNSKNSITSNFILINIDENPRNIAGLEQEKVYILCSGSSSIIEIKYWLIEYIWAGGNSPLIIQKEYFESDKDKFIIQAAGEFGLLLIDKLINGIWLINKKMDDRFNKQVSFHILQASRTRFTSTEYIACPSCGRTLFDIQTALSEVRKNTSHLKGLKIAVMGCIVNGPGEMADADYGYIGSGKGLVSIYKGKEEMRKKVHELSAIKSLIEVIKESGEWVEP